MTDGAPLARYTSLKVGGPPDRWAAPASEEALRRTLREAADREEPVRALGGGRNLLVDDLGVAGTVVTTSRLRAVAIDGALVTAQAGSPLPGLVHRTAAAGLAGLEVLAGIPGTVGGAVRMNAGGHQGEIGDRVVLVRGFRRDGEPFALDREGCGFRYRGSDLEGSFVTEVTLRLEPSGADLGARVKELIAWKAAAQPLHAATAGCTFKNPPGGRSAGLLLDLAGLKGFARGGARFSPRHANFIENSGGATFADVFSLIEEGQRRVWSESGVRLELEVEVWRRAPEAARAVA
ncbi:MAG: UDP-N-acetylmuramate dehydrogenase [Planctomycetes bacterium]|jgi:UDP-N-acetylmuramate dehydrogenase|nr:UDP-N-acetylmuramate dehydrogenase [Planctomycetota bacterium]